MTVDLIRIGKIINTHGVKGELRVLPLTHNIRRYDHLRKIYIGENQDLFEIENVKYHKDLVLIKLKDFKDINQVLSFKNEYIYISHEDKIELPEGHYFIFDIINCEVFDTSGNYIGVVKGVDQSPSNDVYIVKNEHKNVEYLIPAVKEFFVSIDIKEKKIIIDPIEGMIE